MKNIVIILDPAHGKDVSGKRSPDGRHLEYLWSRNRVKEVSQLLIDRGYEVFVTTTSENEPGLSKRKNFASQVKKGHRKLLVSLHNNASGVTMEWRSASGVSVYTTKGVTDADTCADIIINRFEKDFPDEKIRKYSLKPLGKDFEENFTVLMGSGYMGVLIEWLFQDNKTDVEKLQSDDYNKKFVASLVESIEEINKHFSE